MILTALLTLALVQDAHIGALIGKLGSTDFEEREKADQELRKLGEKALPALEKASSHEDLEIAARARRIIDDIKKASRAKARPGIQNNFSMRMVTPEVDLSAGGDGVKLTEKVTGKVYEAPSMEEFKKKHPEVAEKYLKNFDLNMEAFPGDLHKRLRERFRQMPLPPEFGQFPEFDEFFRRRFGQDFRELPLPPPEEEHAVPVNARLGAMVGPLSEPLRQQLGLAEDEGVLVERVEAGSAAEKAGLQAHDVITAVNGARVGNRWSLRQAVGEHARSGKPFEITVVRKAQKKTLSLRFEAPPAPPEKKKTEDF